VAVKTILPLIYFGPLPESEVAGRIPLKPREEEDMHPSIPPLLRYFEYGHLPVDLQLVAMPFHALAQDMAARLGEVTDPGPGAQLNRCLQKLLESKDCAVRAALGQPSEVLH
jgi:hypothetical protein